MIRSILIGLDGSEDGQAAVDLGLRWAKDYDATAIGVAVADEPGVFTMMATATAATFSNVVIDPLTEDERREAAETLRSFARRCKAAGVRQEAGREIGTPFEQLLIEAQRSDLVVLGRRTHFEYRWEKAADKTLAKVLRASPRPVVTVPARPSEGEAVVVAYDGSVQAARALYAFEASGLARSRPVHVVSVFRDREDAALVAGRAVEFLRSHEIDAHAAPIDTGLAASVVILERVRRLDAGLLVMGAYGQPALREFFLGSVTESAMESCSVPMFLYH